MQFEPTLFAVPFRNARYFEMKAPGVAEAVLLVEFLLDRDFETRAVSQFECVLVVTDVDSQRSTVVLVSQVAGWETTFALLLERKKRLPRTLDLADELLGGGASENTDVLFAVVDSVHTLVVNLAGSEGPVLTVDLVDSPLMRREGIETPDGLAIPAP